MKEDIFDEVKRIHEEMELLFDNFFQVKYSFSLTERKWHPSVDVYETKDKVVLVVELAGVQKEDIEISASEKTIHIHGIRKEKDRAESRCYHSMEIRFGPFERKIVLPSRVDPEHIEFKFIDGLLEIELPKIRVSKPEPVTVEIK